MDSVLAGLRAAAEPTRLRLLDRLREGSWVFYRLSQRAAASALARLLAGLVPDDDPIVALDRERLDQIKRTRAESASAYFRANAAQWGKIRSLYVDESEVE